MAYDRADLRSQLSTAGTAVLGANVAPQYFEFGKFAPPESTPAGSELWWARSQTCIVNYVNAVSGDELSVADQPDEYMVLIHDTGAVTTCRAGIGAAADEVIVSGRAVIVMPPGASSISIAAGGDGAAPGIEVVRLFTTQSAELRGRCRNDGFYAAPDPNVAAYAAWPDPPAGHRIRAYRLDDVPADANRFGRLFRCSTLMVNYFEETAGPRDPAKMSPHHHDDFEQLSLQLGGDYVHHIRTPWTVDMAQWRDDEHTFCTSPSVTVIPPPSVHTSQAVGDGSHQLIDIFCPPRLDFSDRPGWVLNADEYPMPER